MPRILVTAEHTQSPPDGPVLLDEWVLPERLSDDHAAEQLVERIGWAVSDADEIERKQPALRR
jgi:hypothetical protein